MNLQKISEAKTAREEAFKNAVSLNKEAWELRTHSPAAMLEKAQEAREYAELSNHPETIGFCYRNIGVARLLLADLDQALQYLQSALDIFKEIDNKKECAHIERNIGVVYSRLTDYNKALEYLLHSLEISRSIRDQNGIAGNLSIVANIYATLNDDEKALEYFKETLVLARQVNDKEKVSSVLGNIGVLYASLGRHHEAIASQLEALTLKEELGNDSSVSVSLSGIGFAYAQIGEYEDAIYFYRRSLKLRYQLNDERGKAVVLSNIGRAYMDIGQNRKALAYLYKALKIADELNATDMLYQIHEACADVHEKEQNFAAYYHLKEFMRIKNELLTEERHKALTSMQLQYDTAHQKMLRQELERKLMDTEHKAIRSQINPHFLSNALNSIQFFLTENDKPSAYRYLSRFGKLIRMTLEHVRQPLIPLSTEFEIVKLYLEMEQLRFGKKVNYTISHDEGIEIKSTYVPPMLLQPYVENALRHGILYRTDNDGYIHVEARMYEEDRIVLIIEDNGIGRQESQRRKSESKTHENHTSFGMSLNEERIALLKETTGKEMLIRVIDRIDDEGRPAGTRIEVDIPFDLAP
ncbi:MAG: tetratricopeptide repeat protein [Bacteroidota bacterium]